MDVVSFLGVLLLLALLFLAYWYLSMPTDVPPGPLGLPIVGNMILESDGYRRLTQMAQKYGPVFSYYSFGTLVVVVNDQDSFAQIVQKQGDKIRDRPNNFAAMKDSGGNFGLISSNGQIWNEQRRFALSTLRDFGFGKPVLEREIMEEVDCLLEAISAKDSKPFDITFLLNNAVSNVISQLVFGKRFDYSDQEFFDVLNQLNSRVAGANAVRGQGLKPWHQILVPGAKKRIAKVIGEGNKIRKYLQAIIDEKKKEYRKENEPENYIHAFLKKRDQDGGPTFVDQQLLISVSSLFEAGTETTSTTLRWVLLFCLRNPEVQERVQKEIEEVVGEHSLPSLSDRSRMPYTEAVILESQRLGNLVPVVGRKAVQDLFYKTKRIPGGSTVLINLWAIHTDPNVFPEPFKFQPERFLDSNNKVKGAEQIFPFGGGKRKCLGEALAKMELFLMFTAMLGRFRFRVPDSDPLPSLKRISGITVQPVPFRVQAIPRT